MSELKSFIVLYDGKFIRAYKESEADKAIAELKTKLAEEREFGLNRAKSADHEIGKLCAEVCELKTENKRLVKCCKEYDSRQRIDERIKFNATKQLRATKRALWLARAERAVAAQSVHEWCRYNEKHPCGLWRADPFEYWVQAWIYVEKLCRKKAKEYK